MAWLSSANVWVALAVMCAAGVSQGVGTQATVLFINSASRHNFWLNLLLTGVVHVVAGLAWGVSIWVVARLLFGSHFPFDRLVPVVAVGSVPYLLGFLVLAPYVGLIIDPLLAAARLVAVTIAAAAAYELELWQAIVVTAAGWVLVRLIERILNRPLVIIQTWLWRSSTGLSTRMEMQDLAVQLAGEAEAESVPAGDRA